MPCSLLGLLLFNFLYRNLQWLLCSSKLIYFDVLASLLYLTNQLTSHKIESELKYVIDMRHTLKDWKHCDGLNKCKIKFMISNEEDFKDFQLRICISVLHFIWCFSLYNSAQSNWKIAISWKIIWSISIGAINALTWHYNNKHFFSFPSRYDRTI